VSTASSGRAIQLLTHQGQKVVVATDRAGENHKANNEKKNALSAIYGTLQSKTMPRFTLFFMHTFGLRG